MKELKNKKVLITGGARGIGKQIALEFARQGADIIICDSDKSFFNKTIMPIRNQSSNTICARNMTIIINFNQIDVSF